MKANRKQIRRLLTLLAAIMIAAASYFGQGLLQPTLNHTYTSEFTMTVLALDKADCILLEYRGKTVLVDGGENSDAGSVVGFLNARKIRYIDVMVGTHPHSDHIGGLDDVLNEIDTGMLLVPFVPEDKIPAGNHHEKLMQAALDNGVEIVTATAGDVFKIDEIHFDVLSPCRSDYKDENDFSLVIRAEFGDVSVLLTGDATAVAEREILENPVYKELLDCDILKVGHHGGNTSTTQKFVAAVSPRIALITGRQNPDQAGISAAVTERLKKSGAAVYNTATSGRILCYAEDGELCVKTSGN